MGEVVLSMSFPHSTDVFLLEMAVLVPVHRPLPLTPPVAAGRLAEVVFRTKERGGPINNWSAPASRTESPVACDTFGHGIWKDGKHVGSRNTRLEKELFRDLNGPTKRHTGINMKILEFPNLSLRLGSHQLLPISPLSLPPCPQPRK